MMNLEVVGALKENDGLFSEVEVTLPDFTKGITHRAAVAKGECVVFRFADGEDDLLVARVYDVAHEWQMDGEAISTAYASWEEPITDKELDFLLSIGFEQTVRVNV